MWQLDHKESWALKNWWLWTVVLEKTCECPFHSKEIKPIQGNQPWIFIGKADAEAEALLLWPQDMEKLTHWKRPWCPERLREGGTAGNREWDIVWHYRLNGHEFEQTLGDGEGQGSLECCNPWGCTDTTEQLNNNNGHLLHSKQNLNSSTMAKYRSRIYLPLSWPHFVLFFLGLCFGSSNKHFFLDQGPVSLLSTFPW